MQRDADVYELALADIYVGAGVTAITQSKITDQRLNTSLCGVVAAVVQQIDTAAFNAQLQAWFAEYQSLSAAEYNTLVSYMNSLKLQVPQGISMTNFNVDGKPVASGCGGALMLPARTDKLPPEESCSSTPVDWIKNMFSSGE